MPDSTHVLFSGCLAQPRTLTECFGCLKAMNLNGSSTKSFLTEPCRPARRIPELSGQLFSLPSLFSSFQFYVKGMLGVYSAVSKTKTFSETETQLH